MRLVAEGLLIWFGSALGVLTLLICGACMFRIRNGRWPDEPATVSRQSLGGAATPRRPV